MAAIDEKIEKFIQKEFPGFHEKALQDAHTDSDGFYKLIGGKTSDTALFWAYLYLLKQLLRGKVSTIGKDIDTFVKNLQTLCDAIPNSNKMVIVCFQRNREIVIGKTATCGDPGCCGWDDKIIYRVIYSWFFEWSTLINDVKEGFVPRPQIHLSPVECTQFLLERLKPCYYPLSFRPAYKIVYERFEKEKSKPKKGKAIKNGW